MFDPALNEGHVQECMKRLLVLCSAAPNTACSLRQLGHIAALYLLYNINSTEALHFCISLRWKLR